MVSFPLDGHGNGAGWGRGRILSLQSPTPTPNMPSYLIPNLLSHPCTYQVSGIPDPHPIQIKKIFFIKKILKI